jgi:hypothetical protein
VVHKWQRLRGLEGIWLFIVDPRKTYVASTSPPLLLLIDLHVRQRAPERVCSRTSPPQHFEQRKAYSSCINQLCNHPGHQWHLYRWVGSPSLLLFRLQRHQGSKISAPYSLLSSSNSAINHHPSTTSSSSFTLPTVMARSNRNCLALTQCLENMLKVQGETPIYLIIDALDECPDTSGVPSHAKRSLSL